MVGWRQGVGGMGSDDATNSYIKSRLNNIKIFSPVGISYNPLRLYASAETSDSIKMMTMVAIVWATMGVPLMPWSWSAIGHISAVSGKKKTIILKSCFWD